MSMPREEKIICPKCGHEIQVTVWDSINTEMPNAAQDIITGRLFEIDCEACGYSTHVSYPILFNDLEHGTMIWLSDSKNEADVEKAARLMQGSDIGVTCRIVRSQTALREKTMIVSRGLDDRIIELLKVMSLEHIKPTLGEKKVTGIFYNSSFEPPRFEVQMGDETGFLDVDMEAYEKLQDIFADALADVENNGTQVDNLWAIRFLQDNLE